MLLNIPKFDSEIAGSRSKSVFNNRMPSGIENLLTVALELSISLSDVLLKTIVAQDPKLEERIIRSRGKKVVIEGRELDIVDSTLVTVAKWDSDIELLVGIGFEAGEGTCTIPANSSKLTIAGNTVRITLVVRDDTVKDLGGFDTYSDSKIMLRDKKQINKAYQGDI